jgi:hypothetical protein
MASGSVQNSESAAGDHRARGYLAEIKALKHQFARLASG